MPLENLTDLEAEWAVFMEDKPGNRGGWTQDQRWRADNPGELAALQAYRGGGQRPTTITTATGRRMLEHAAAYIKAKGTAVPPPVDTSAPVVSISSPAGGATVKGSVWVVATATDNVGVVKVEFFRDGTSIGSDTSAPYATTVDTVALADGSHTFGARAYDAAGNIGYAPEITVTVDNGVTLPPPGGTAPWKGSFDASYQAAPLGSVIVVPAGTYPGEVIRWRSSAAQKGGQMIKFTMGGAVTLTGPLEVRGSAVWVDGGNRLSVKGYVDTEADSVANHPDNVILENLKCVSIGVFNAEKVTCRNLDVGPSTTYCSSGSQIVAREGRGFECKIGFAGGVTYVPKDILFDGVKIHNQNGDETRLQSGCDIHFGGLFLVTADGLTLKDCVFERNVVYHIQIQNFGGSPQAKRVLIDHCSFGAPVDWLYKGDVPDNQRAIQFDYDPGTEFTLTNNVCANGPQGLYGCYVGDCGGFAGLKTSGNKDLPVSTTAPPLL